MALRERPVCTCITRTVPSLDGLTGKARLVRLIRVLDPFCQILTHKISGSTNFEPDYSKKEK